MKYYRDLENEKYHGQLVTSDDLFEEYVSLCRDESINPEETSFSDFLFNALECNGGTLTEVHFDRCASYYITHKDALIRIEVPNVYTQDEVKEFLCDTIYVDKLASIDALNYVCARLKGSWCFEPYIGEIHSL